MEVNKDRSLKGKACRPNATVLKRSNNTIASSTGLRGSNSSLASSTGLRGSNSSLASSTGLRGSNSSLASSTAVKKSSSSIASSTALSGSNKSTALSTDEAEKISDELRFHYGLMDLYKKAYPQNPSVPSLTADEILSQVLYLENKCRYVQEAVVKKAQKFSQLKEMLASMEASRTLTPQLESIAVKLEEMKISDIFPRLLITLDVLHSHVDVSNLDTISKDDVDRYIDLMNQIEPDLQNLKMVRAEGEPILNEGTKLLGKIGELLKRFNDLNEENQKLKRQLEIRNIQERCLPTKQSGLKGLLASY